MNNEFNEPPEELKRVAEEISLLRKEIQSASIALGRIERRLKSIFPNYPLVKINSKNSEKSSSTFPLKTDQELQIFFNELVLCTQTGGDSAFADKIEEFGNEDVIALAKEIGITSKNRLSRQKAIVEIRKKVQEALQIQFENRLISHR